MTTTAYGPTIVTSGLSLLLDAGNSKSYSGSGSTWYDLSPNKYEGTITGATYSSGYLDFSGSGNVTISGTTEILHGSTNFAYSCWIRWDTFASTSSLFQNGDWTNDVNSFKILYTTVGIDGFSLYSVAGDYGRFSFSPTVNTWYNLTFVRNNNNMYFYNNGVQHATVVPFNPHIVPSPTTIIFGQGYNAKVATVSIYTNSLSSTEVYQNFAALRGRFGV